MQVRAVKAIRVGKAYQFKELFPRTKSMMRCYQLSPPINTWLFLFFRSLKQKRIILRKMKTKMKKNQAAFSKTKELDWNSSTRNNLKRTAARLRF